MGIMGLHDMLIQMEVPYGSKEGRALAGKVMKFIRDTAEQCSIEQAKEKTPFPAYDPKVNLYPANRHRINDCRLCLRL